MKLGLVYKVIILFILGLGMSSCVPEKAKANNDNSQNERHESVSMTSLTVREYINYIVNPENGLCVSKEVGEITYTLQYKPLEYLVILEKQKDTLLKKELDQRTAELKDMEYFTLKIEAKNNPQELLKYKLESEVEYNERVKYFSFDMQKDIYLKSGTDSIPCALYHFERTYGAAPYANFVLGFLNDSKLPAQNDKYFTLHDRVFDGGKINIKISKKDIQRIPKLITY